MKRLLTLAVLFLCCMATSFAQFSGSGSGTESDPYLITNPIHLNQLRNYLNKSGVYFKLMEDIDLTEFLEDENPTQGWQPIGTTSTHFKGILDGNGKSITGLWISRSSSDYVGLFGYLENAIVKNISIGVSSINGRNCTGIISGKATKSTISNCYLVGTVSGKLCVGGCLGEIDNCTLSTITSLTDVTASDNYTGGIVGNANGTCTFTSCSLTCDKITGMNYVGGISGASVTGNLTSCYVHCDISGTDRVGGMLGQSENSSGTNITNCGFFGNINGGSFLGGLVGAYSCRAEMKGSCAIARVSGNGNSIGGLVGANHDNSSASNYPTLSNCYFSGIASGNAQVGGLVGHSYNGTIKCCYANASVSGGRMVGGICGKIEGNNSLGWDAQLFSNVAIISSAKATQNDVGRIYGSVGSRVTIGEMGTANENKAWNRTIVINAGVAQQVIDGQQNGTGVSKTTLELKATYENMGFDFNDTWEIQESECFPYMKTQTAPPVIQSQVVSGATTISGKCVDGGIITLEIDGVKQQMVSSGNTFSFTVSPLQAGHEVRVCAKADGKEQSYYTTETVSYIGKGTEADPYQIYTAADLTGVYRKGYFKLMNDIDLTSYINQFSPTEGWESIGREGSETIHFDGNGHKITGLWCNSTRDNTGLFSCFANGEIKNLTVVTASGKQVKGGVNTGILIGKMMNGTLTNCSVSGSVADGTPVGGIVGLMDGGNISECQASVTITTTGATSYVGGLVGHITSGTIDQCVTTGKLTATGTESYVGGVVGKNYSTVTNCYSTANITSSYNAAGIVAYNYSLVDKCLYTGNLYSNNYAAGIIGYNDGENASVQNCVATSNIIDVRYESQQTQQGGGYGQRIIGGIKNNAPAPDKTNNYALKTMQVSVNGVAQRVYDDIMNGTAKSEAELKSQATYETLGWDFANVWNIDEGTSYPYQTVKADSGSNPEDPDDPNPEDPNPQTNVEVTDISQLDNIIYMENYEGKSGTQATLSLRMKNSAPIRSFQFDLYLPAGVTAAKSSKGKILGQLSPGRLPDEDEHTLTFSEQPDGAIRFLCGSQYDEVFTGNEGEIATLTVNIAEAMADGEYPIQLKNMVLTETDISRFYETSLVQSKLTITSYMTGDINGDGIVNVLDYTGVANHIHGSTPAGFVEKAADVDENDIIDVRDYTGVANIIHTGSITGAAASRANKANKNTDMKEPQ